MIDVTRSLGVFNPGKYREDIHIIGVGAVGSHICEGLIQQGVTGSQIHVYDYDDIESHNISNQLYTRKNVGQPKVDALYNMMADRYDEHIKIHNVEVDDSFVFKGVIFLIVDTFKARKAILKSIQFKPDVKLLIETRLDARAGICMTLDIRNYKHVSYFKNTLFDDDEDDSSSAEVSACGTRQVVVQTVKILSGMAVWEFMKWVNDSMYTGKRNYFSSDPWYLKQNEIK